MPLAKKQKEKFSFFAFLPEAFNKSLENKLFSIDVKFCNEDFLFFKKSF